MQQPIQAEPVEKKEDVIMTGMLFSQ